MVAATLSEQIGSMAIIDELRQRQMVVQEHLDLPQRRTEVARRIREYYQSRNITVEEAVVEQGVREYFDRRLQFEAPRIGRVASFVANLYVSRDRWMKPAAAALAAAVVLVTGGALASAAYQRSLTAAVRELSTRAAEEQSSLQRDIQEQITKFDELGKRLESRPVPAASRMLLATAPLLSQAAKLVGHPLPATIDAANRDAAKGHVEQVQHDLDQASDLVKTATSKITDTAHLLDANDSFLALTASAPYAAALGAHPILAEAASGVQRNIEDAEISGTAAVDAAMHRLTEMMADVPAADALAKDIQSGRAKLLAIGLKQEERDQVASIAFKGLTATKALDVRTAKEATAELAQTEQFALLPLTLRIVERAGVKSGIERRYKPSGGKSWFLIVEAVDPTGTVVPIPVESAETGVKKKVERFGISVPQEEYQKVKEAKLRTGHVGTREVGEKPANSLSFVFTRGIPAKPDMILEW